MPFDEKGLTVSEAQALLQKHGPNSLPEKPPPSDISLFMSQLKNPLVYVLLGAALVTLFLGRISDTAIIFFAVLINTTLGFFQERRAGKALYALKELIHPQAKLIRDGNITTIGVENVVPGDIAILDQGSKIPADGKLLQANRLYISEAILTGESSPVSKNKNDKVHMGTIISSGNAVMLVEVTGQNTEIGKIALDVQEKSEDTPLKRQLTRFSKQLTVLVLFLTLFVFAVGLLVGRPLDELFTTSVALAVSSIPEGLLVSLTAVLALGIQRIVKRKALVRTLVSAETLGGVTTLCVDKTGTLTEGKMRVTDYDGDLSDISLQALLANDQDTPVAIASWEWAQKNQKDPKQESKTYRRLDSIPFSSQKKYFTSLHRWKQDKNIVFVNGAPDFILEWTTLSKKEKARINSQIDHFTKEGKRLIGFARKEVPSAKTKLHEGDIKQGLTWVGLLAHSDPVRKGVNEAFQRVMAAGIKFIVITGDYPQTALSVMAQCGIPAADHTVVLGSELTNLSVNALSGRIARNNIALFARTTPNQKLKIVEALKKNNEVVAMMGDGVNDAPALKKADIGIVVGEATDVAKETADLVLLDSNFATIVAAIEEGRSIFDNIRKIILYLMSDAFEEIIAVIASILLFMPLPVTSAQILWINLISDGFPNLALTVDPKLPDTMKRKPRPPGENLVTGWMRSLIFIVSFSGGIAAFILFYIVYANTGDIVLSRSIAFLTLGINSLFYVFSIRTLTDPFWKENPLENKWLNFAVILGLILQLIPFTTPALREFFGLSRLLPLHYFAVFTVSSFMFIIIEITKLFIRRHTS